MIWRTKYEAFLEAENTRLRADNRLLMSALLERAGHREAANFLRGPAEPLTDEKIAIKARKPVSEPVKKMQEGFASRAWRNMKHRLQESTRPEPVAGSSAEQLEKRVQEQIDASV